MDIKSSKSIVYNKICLRFQCEISIFIRLNLFFINMNFKSKYEIQLKLLRTFLMRFSLCWTSIADFVISRIFGSRTSMMDNIVLRCSTILQCRVYISNNIIYYMIYYMILYYIFRLHITPFRLVKIDFVL